MSINNLSLLNSLDNAQKAQAQTFQRLSSGLRINSAAQDPAGDAIAAALTAQIGGTDQAIRNIGSSLDLTNTASGGLGQLTDALQQIRTLAVQAQNGANNPGDLQAIQGQINQLSQSIDQIAGTTQFDGQNLLDGTFNAQLQTGASPTDTQTLALANTSSSGLGVSNIDVTTQPGAANALSAIDSALQTVSSQQAAIGATQASLNSSIADLSSSYVNLAASRSAILDTDYAQETSTLAQNNIMSQTAISALAAYNKEQSSVLSLLK